VRTHFIVLGNSESVFYDLLFYGES
jgi:hypothetical protein